MGMQPLFLLGLGGHSKEAGDEGDLPAAVSFAHPSDLSLQHFCNITLHSIESSSSSTTESRRFNTTVLSGGKVKRIECGQDCQ